MAEKKPTKQLGVRAKLRKHFLNNLGRIIESEELRNVAGGTKEWARRVRELRQEGLQILTVADRDDLRPGQYLLESKSPSRGHKFLIVLGNGFSLDLMSKLGAKDCSPLTNIFGYGDRIPWPDRHSKHGFISFRGTPNLWTLGVRPGNLPEQNNQILENIITCVNVSYFRDNGSPPTDTSGEENYHKYIYFRAYIEL